MTDSLILVAEVVGVHGVRGAVKLRSFTADPAAVAGYGPLSDHTGRGDWRLRILGEARGTLVVAVAGIEDRNAAAALKGLRLFVPRARLPVPDDDEFYLADLIGLEAATADGVPYGRVVAVHNFGAGDLLEIDRSGSAAHDRAPALLPFTRTIVPAVDLASRRLVVAPPAGIDTAAVPEPDADSGDAGGQSGGGGR